MGGSILFVTLAEKAIVYLIQGQEGPRLRFWPLLVAQR